MAGLLQPTTRREAVLTLVPANGPVTRMTRVLRRPRVDPRRDLLPHVAQQQALAADVALGPLHVERLDGGGARAQVDPEHLALVEVQCVLLTTCVGIPTVPLRRTASGSSVSQGTWDYRLRHSSRRPARGATARKRPACRAKRSRNRAPAPWPLPGAGRAPGADAGARLGAPTGCVGYSRPGASGRFLMFSAACHLL